MNKFVLTKLQLEKSFLIYLDEEGILKELQMKATEYEKSIDGLTKRNSVIPLFRFHLKLDLIKIQEISEKLHHFFMKEPEAGIDLAKKVIYCALNLMISTIKLAKSDLQIILLVINLPITFDISDLFHYPSYGLESVQGVLVAKTSVSKYVRSPVYRCKLLSCSGSNWRRYPENSKKICSKCFSLMEEDVSSTDIGEEILCQFVSLKAYQSLGRFQFLKVRIKDELCGLTDLCVGEEYRITGRLIGSFFIAMNVQAKQREPENIFNSVFLNSFEIPKSIVNLFIRVSSNCPWSFVFALSSHLGSPLIAPSLFLHLKMGLMLSLSTQKNNQVPIPLVAVGEDSFNAQFLFHTAGKLAERYVRHSIAHSHLGGATKPGFQSDVIWQEAGQLILAAKGVCNLGDWSKFKNEQANYICQTIESGQIILNKCDFGKKNVINFVPLNCAIWTYWCHITTSHNDQLKLKTLINVFGMPFLAEEKNETEMVKICCKQLDVAKRNFENSINTDFIPLKDLKDFIEIINSRELILSDSASQLIRSYFVVSRRERPQCLPIGAIKTMTSLAEAHARLALRDEVLYEDVLVIIYLYEEAISTLFGESIKHFSKLIWDQKEPIYFFMGRQLQQFKIWLEEYISL